MSAAAKLQIVEPAEAPKPAKSKPAKPARKATTRKAPAKPGILRHAPAAGVGVVAVALTGLSLTHLATGISLVTGADGIEAGAMAVGIDVGFIALELAQISAGEAIRKAVSKWASPAIAGTLCGSAALNAMAFAAQANGPVMQGAAIALGVSVPLLVYAMTRVAAVLASDKA
jgi:hypothetical protein